MCLYAILWANIEHVYYGCTIEDNSDIGFRDGEYAQLDRIRETLFDYMTCTDRDACLKLFEIYNQMEHTIY